MTVRLPDIERTFRTGYNYSFNRVNEELEWAKWYDNEFNSLFRGSPDVFNGRALYNIQDEIRIPLFRDVTDFYADAVLGELPEFITENEQVLAWLKENMPMIAKSLQKGCLYWARHGIAVWTAEDGLINAVNPTHYYRAGQTDQPDKIVGHLLAFPYRELTDLDIQNPDAYQANNRIRIVRIPVDGNVTDELYALPGGSRVGDLLEQESATVRGIITAGEADSWYEAVRDIAAALIVRMSILNREVNDFVNRPQWMPAGAMDDIKALVALTTKDPTMREVTEAFRKLVRPVVGLDADEQPPIDDSAGPDIQAEIELIDRLFDQYYIGCGLPTSAFGIGIGKGESGVARERAEDRAVARVRAVRRDIAAGLPGLLVAAGCPSDDFSVQWVAGPFDDRSKSLEEIEKLLQLGLITVKQAASMYGIQYDEKGLEQERQRRMEEAQANNPTPQQGDE